MKILLKLDGSSSGGDSGGEQPATLSSPTLGALYKETEEGAAWAWL